MTDDETLRVYDAQAAEYAAAFGDAVPEDLAAFAALLPAGGRVLDLGAGPGTMAGWLAGRGFAVEAWDASPAMVALAEAVPGVTARLRRFEDLDAEDAFDGVWASFSLLHARRSELPGLIGRIARALRPGGAAFVGMKVGTGERRDALGRRYSFVTEAELTGWLRDVGLTIVTVRTGSAKGMAGTDDPFVAVTAHG